MATRADGLDKSLMRIIQCSHWQDLWKDKESGSQRGGLRMPVEPDPQSKSY